MSFPSWSFFRSFQLPVCLSWLVLFSISVFFLHLDWFSVFCIPVQPRSVPPLWRYFVFSSWLFCWLKPYLPYFPMCLSVLGSANTNPHRYITALFWLLLCRPFLLFDCLALGLQQNNEKYWVVRHISLQIMFWHEKYVWQKCVTKDWKEWLSHSMLLL